MVEIRHREHMDVEARIRRLSIRLRQYSPPPPRDRVRRLLLAASRRVHSRRGPQTPVASGYPPVLFPVHLLRSLAVDSSQPPRPLWLLAPKELIHVADSLRRSFSHVPEMWRAREAVFRQEGI